MLSLLLSLLLHVLLHLLLLLGSDGSHHPGGRGGGVREHDLGRGLHHHDGLRLPAHLDPEERLGVPRRCGRGVNMCGVNMCGVNMCGVNMCGVWVYEG